MTSENIVKVGFAEAYYDSFTGAQQSMIPLITGSTLMEGKLIIPSAGELSDRAGDLDIDSHVINYPNELDVFNKRLIEFDPIKNTKIIKSLLSYYKKLIEFYRSSRYDLIYCNNIRSTMLFAPPAKILNIPVVSYIRGDKRVPYVEKPRLITSDRIVCISDETMDRFSKLEKYYSNKITKTINTGVDTEKYSPKENKSKSKTKIKITQLATIQDRKGQKVLLEAAGEISNTVRDHHINLAGPVPDGATAYRQELESICKEGELTGNVSFLGWVEDVPTLLNETDIFVLPSYNEGLPRSLLEAAATGVPMIVTPAGGAEKIVKDGETGFVVPFGDHQELADSLETLVNRPDLRKEMGKNARELAENEFSVESYVDEFEGFVIEELL